MTNKLTCPTCHQSHEVKDYILATDADMMFKVALTVPPELSNLVLKYVQLFAPKKSALSIDRQAKLIQSMHLEGCDINRVAYGIVKCLDNLSTGSLKPPLKSHGYLQTVMNGYTPPDEAEVKKYSLTAKQVKFFGIRLCQDNSFAMKFAQIGEDDGSFMARVEHGLRDPEQVKKWYGYIERISQQAEKQA